MPDPEAGPLGPEDAKLVTLARAARQRAHVRDPAHAEGAAVRDSDGRSYAATTVASADPRWTTTALHGAIVAAASSGARRLEAAVLVTAARTELGPDAKLERPAQPEPAARPEPAADPPEGPLLREFDVPILYVVTPEGELRRTWSP